MVDTLSYDTLYRISQFLSPREVSGLAAVNKYLRNSVGLDAKFGEVKLDKHDSRMKGICEMLSRGEVAKHVRRFRVQLWRVQPGTKTHASRSENVWNHVNTFFNPHYMEQQAERRVRRRIRKDVARVTEAIRCLRYVEEYYVTYDEQSHYHRELFDAFLSPTLEIFAPKLHKLSIKVPFELLSHLSYVHLPKLRDLDICLCTGEASMNDIKYALDGFFVFLHNITTLEHLGISATPCSRRLNLSSFSDRWGKFPGLKSLGLCIPFDGATLLSPEGFYKHVVEPHALTLEKLSLNATRASVPLGPARHCQYWIQRIVKSSSNTVFPRLREVELALRPLKASLDDLKVFLGNRAPTLEKLSLTDRALEIHELRELFESLCPSSAFSNGRNDVLRCLKMKVNVLSPTLLVLAAERFPELKSLDLTFADVWGGHAPHSQQNLYAAFTRFLMPYKSTLFAKWGLRNLNLDEGPTKIPWLRTLERICVDWFGSPVPVGEFSYLII